MDKRIHRTVEALRKNGFEVFEAATKEEACRFLLSAIRPGAQVGVGGSVSVRETGVLPELEKMGCMVHSHWGVPAQEVRAVQRRAREADVYLCSANAVTTAGRLVLIDGRGNRVGAVCDGPEEVYFVVGQQKIVEGGHAQAVARIKAEACPQNARRLNLETPCARTGSCHESECEHTSCCLVLEVSHALAGRKMTVVLVEEELGY